MKLSVIIPTYNRKEILAKTLESYTKQTLSSSQFELIIADDGSTDGTEELVGRYIQGDMTVIYTKQKQSGPAEARNKAIRLAKGEYVFFAGDDIIPSKTLLAEHLTAHEKYGREVAILGQTNWWDKIKTTDYMRWLIANGHQFDWRNLKNGQTLDYNRFYSSNISVAKSWLKEEKFDSALPHAAFEDIELGYRLEKKGLKIIFDSNAIAYHNHVINEKEFCQKVKYTGEGLAYVCRKFPGFRNLNVLKAKSLLMVLTYPGLLILTRVGHTHLRWKWNILFNFALGVLYGNERPRVA